MCKVFVIGFGAAVSVLCSVASTNASPITVPPGLHAGDQYRLAFVTRGLTTPSSPDIATYNSFVSAEANAIPELAALGTNWSAIASTDGIDAEVNTATNVRPGVPIYLLDGTKLVNNYDDLWNLGLQEPLHVVQDGTPSTTGGVWTGTNIDGTKLANPAALGDAHPVLGNSNSASGFWISWLQLGTGPAAQLPLYGISGTLQVVPEPSTGLLAVLACGMIWLGRKRFKPSA